MKTVLFYGLFWVLGAIASLIIGVSRGAYYVFMLTKDDGRADPAYMAGLISESIVSWMMNIIVVTVIVYPLYALLREKFRFLWLYVTIGLVIASTMLSLIIAYFDLAGFFVKLIGVGVFIYIGVELPNRINTRKKLKMKLNATGNLFD